MTPDYSVVKSNALFERASRVIPLASQTFSKSHYQVVKGVSPLFIESGRGAHLVDPDGNRYIDYILGLLPVILGYGDPDVDGAIVEQLGRGITFSLPSPLEIDLAERLVRLIPCAEMVRFGKNGSDATTAAVRLARAHTGRDGVVVCGYHGWHDWCIGTTSRCLGVPAAVKALSTSIPYNDADALAALLRDGESAYAAMIIEPVGAEPPAPGYLEALRALTETHGVVLIFDEIITGFRIHMGGAQAHYGVTPDLATFGKAMANGMPISAVVGRRELMMLMEDIFFSTTFGGEALSLAAAIATIDKLERVDGVARLQRRGASLSVAINGAIRDHGLETELRMHGPDWRPCFEITSADVEPVLMTSLLRQEFVANGLLMSGALNLCLAHDDDAIANQTMAAMARALAAVRTALDSPNPVGCLRGAPVRTVFSVR